MSGNKIKSAISHIYRIPLKEPLSDAKHGIQDHFEVITVTVTLENGDSGCGYTYTGGKGGWAIKAMLDHDILPAIIGLDASKIDEIYDMLFWHIHYVGRGGISSFAISAVDIALWDIKCKQLDKPLVDVINGKNHSCLTYRGGVDLFFPDDKLVDSVKGYLEQGYKAVKIKVGHEDLDDDVRRVQKIRDTIGPNMPFMVDANYSLTLDRAIYLSKAIEKYNITWFEEPLVPDDYEGYGKLKDATNIPLSQGENLHIIYEYEQALKYCKLDYVQPDASNCGGITGWLRAAKLFAEKGVAICSHGMQELHVSLVSAFDTGWLEIHSYPIEDYTKAPVKLNAQGRAIAPSSPGIGVEFDLYKLQPYLLG